MHLSLKGSMDRQPLTDRLGDRLLAEYGGAAAAYSLRALNGNGDSVVRVRRASDNDEKDFTAEQIELGEMVNWVNSQIVPPLDIGVLTPEGRIPVPEGGTSIGIPAAAYSLRNLSTTYTGNVVDVRRSSDDAEDSFTATEVADGTLTDWVGVGNDGFVTQWYDQSGNDNHATQGTDASQPMIVDGGSLVTGGLDFDGVNDFLTNSANIFAQTFSVFTVQTSDTDETVGISFSREYFTPNQRITISSDTRTVTKRLANYAPDATDRFINRVSKQSANTEEFITLISDGSNMAAWLDGVSVGAVTSTATPSSPNHGFRIGKQDTGPVYHSGPIQELIIYPSDQSANRTAIEANIGETYGITGIPAYDNTVDGFVETWYDQSGNGNDATQSVAAGQPKIVDGGSLVTGGLDFDGSSSAMDIDGLALESTEYYMTAVIDLDVVPSGSLKTIFDSTDGNNAGAALAYANTGSQLTPFMLDGDDTSVNVFSGGANLTTSKTLVGCQFKSGASESHINGGVNSTLSNTWTSAGTNTFTKSTIGYDQTNSNRNLDGKLAELIVYESDQSANRVGIETNINDHYNIY
jgi:hypothetical protein